MEQFFPFILLAVMLVVLLVLPARQRKRMQEQAAAMQASLEIGTPVMTTSGLHGTVAKLGDTTVDLEIAPGVVVTFIRQAILEVRRPAEPTVVAEDPARPADGTV
ncbi:preprotein translocase subunit YajC [Blastococcus sp. TBT05-19]|uniref:preprotein translocase subunit YajC n=1 Tax=Blastococcus sp. TBT05-19 TaxID=2250581 RepID=UPI001F31B627|nr:preprotein translocase subunit YajC [Blastococcus sp. TBT05-19]